MSSATLPSRRSSTDRVLHLQFAGYGTVAEQQAFFKYLLPWMEQQAFIFRYAAFGESLPSCPCQLCGATAELSPLS